MKVIDLLNKIANKEEVPEKIKYKGNIYKLEHSVSHLYNYIDIDNNGDYLEDDWYLTNILNDEIEIVEDTPKEDKKIDKLDLQYKDITKGIKFEEQILMYCDNLQYKINEIIDKLNGDDNED